MRAWSTGLWSNRPGLPQVPSSMANNPLTWYGQARHGGCLTGSNVTVGLAAPGRQRAASEKSTHTAAWRQVVSLLLTTLGIPCWIERRSAGIRHGSASYYFWPGHANIANILFGCLSSASSSLTSHKRVARTYLGESSFRGPNRMATRDGNLVDALSIRSSCGIRRSKPVHLGTTQTGLARKAERQAADTRAVHTRYIAYY